MSDSLLSAGTIFVTGSNGCLGRHVLLALIARNDVAPNRIHAFSLHSPSDTSRIAGVIYHQGDTSDAAAVSKAMSEARPELVIHTAGISAFLADNESILRVNIEGTRNVLHAAQKAGVKAFVHTSSASVVDDGYSDLINIDETAPVRTLNMKLEDAYNYSKAKSEEIILSENRNKSMLTTSLRVSVLFGPGDKQATQRSIEGAKAGKLVFQLGDDKSCITPVFAENAADCHVLAWKALLEAHGQPAVADADRVDGEAFFLTNGTPINFWTFSRQLGAAAGYPTDATKIRVIPKVVALTGASVIDWIKWVLSFGKQQQLRKKFGYLVRWRAFDITKAQTRLGYEPAISLEEGIAKAGAWFKDEEGKAKTA